MSVTGLDLAAWISFYLGLSLIRTNLPRSEADGAPSARQKKLTAAGSGLLVLGLLVFALALHSQFQHSPRARMNPTTAVLVPTSTR